MSATEIPARVSSFRQNYSAIDKTRRNEQPFIRNFGKNVEFCFVSYKTVSVLFREIKEISCFTKHLTGVSRHGGAGGRRRYGERIVNCKIHEFFHI